MSSTTGRGRATGLPTPARSAIPTPGRSPFLPATVQHTASSLNFDKAHHQNPRFSDASSVSLSPQSSIFSTQAGHRSTPARPSSAASSSSAVSSILAKSPTGRPSSRHSDAFSPVSERASEAFGIGDYVRIESTGHEGILRYLGEIDGRAGIYAGVELTGDYAGQGKNNGLANGKQYFTCPPKCGIFVDSAKLSAASSAQAGSRPSSVASSIRNGRSTPSASGRGTPSVSTSKSSGRVTPSHSTGPLTSGPASTRANRIGKPGSIPGPKLATPVLRTPKYSGATPSRPDSRDSGSASPTRSTGMSSPTRSSRISSPTRRAGLSASQSSTGPPSPTRSAASPFPTTPKRPANGRTSNIGSPFKDATPSKARIPSPVAMPPPPLPASALERLGASPDPDGHPFDESQDQSATDLVMKGRAIQNQLSQLLSGKMDVNEDGRAHDLTASDPTSRESKTRSLADRLQVRVDALEQGNGRTIPAADSAKNDNSNVPFEIHQLRTEKEQALAHVLELEGQLQSAEHSLSEREAKVEALERSVKDVETTLEKVRDDGEQHVKELQSRLEDREAHLKELNNALEVKQGQEDEAGALIAAKDAEIASLEARLQEVTARVEEEKQELNAQVDELRQAGQETIALYEERLSAAETKRYELEDLVTSLQDQLQLQNDPTSPTTAMRHRVSATQIDNETLRDQVQYLQKRVSSLEDMLEDAKMSAEKEEESSKEVIKVSQEAADNLKKEVAARDAEAQKAEQSQAKSLKRLQEVEGALRESTLALENARAEIEHLRVEVLNLESLAAADVGPGDSSEKRAEIVQRGANERARLNEELSSLRQQLEESRRTDREAAELSSSDVVEDLKHRIDALESEKRALLRLNEENQAQVIAEQRVVLELRRALEDLSTARAFSPSKHDTSPAREEITGLKHIVQDLQSENESLSQQNRVLSSEQQLLLSEMQSLREELKRLEEKLNPSLLNNGLPSSPAPSDPDALHKCLKDLQAKHEVEIEKLQRSLADADKKNARTIHDLNKEVGELESLIETKIYREDELEREIEQLKAKLGRGPERERKKSTRSLKSNQEWTIRPTTAQQESTINTKSFPLLSEHQGQEATNVPVCEICEKPGHDIFSCDLLAGTGKDASKTATPGPPSVPVEVPQPSLSKQFTTTPDTDAEKLFCEDCEGYGHLPDDCPFSTIKDDDLHLSPKVTKATVNEGSKELFCEDCEGYGHLPDDCPFSGDVF